MDGSSYCHGSIFVFIFESIFNVHLGGIDRSSDAPLESQINNVDIIINELEHILSNIDLSHITGEKVSDLMHMLSLNRYVQVTS